MSIARHHAEWLSLVPVSGPFLSLPVLMEAFNTGLEPHDPNHVRLLRQEYANWLDSFEKKKSDPAAHHHWIQFVLNRTLDLDDDVLVQGQAISQTLQVEVPEHHEFLKPSVVVSDPSTKKPRLLVQIYPRTQELTSYVANSRWKASPDTRMTELLHATGVRLGLVTNGEHWMLVDAPKGETSGYSSWYASLWLEEKITLQAFRTLLSASRFFNVPDDQTLEALLTKSASNQQEVTDQLGYQVRRAVEVLIHSLDRADQDFGRQLLAGVPESALYESALTVMMRLVFLFCAEERELIPSKPFPVYEQNYSVSTICKQLRELADQHGEELLERRYDAWPRLLAAFRAVYGGLKHDDVHIPAYGGSLFNPDRFPFLEGRLQGTSWKDTEANPLPVNNRTVLHLLEALQFLQIKVPGGGPAEARRVSFRALGIEQIGHVYEGLLDHTAKRATEPFLGLAGTRAKEPEFPLAEIEKYVVKGESDLIKFLKEATGKSEIALKKAFKLELDKQDAALFRTACQSDGSLWKRVEPLAGLLRTDSFGYPVVIPQGSVFVTAGTDRRSSGTHYTPLELTEPIVQYTLEPLVYVGPAEGKPRSEWKLKSAKELLDLKICDMACGSGAFLVQVCRYLAARLLEAWEEIQRVSPNSVRITPEGDSSTGKPNESLIPDDPEERRLYAMRIVAQRCLYGVDINPLAVEMAKLSLWLLTMAKDKPFEFLDHNIRCGDSLIGIHNIDQLRQYNLKPASEKTTLLKGDDAVNEVIALRLKIEDLPANSVEDVQRQEKLLQEANQKIAGLRCAADMLVSAEFWGENARDKAERSRHAYDVSKHHLEENSIDEFEKVAAEERRGQKMFHWSLEFPEVIVKRGGFDAFVGNPPFLGCKYIQETLGSQYLEYLSARCDFSIGKADLVAHFFRRTQFLLRPTGCFGLVGTKSIAQGDTKVAALVDLKTKGFRTYRATQRFKWPGTASVSVSVVHAYLGNSLLPCHLEGEQVGSIDENLEVGTDTPSSNTLLGSSSFSFIGYMPLGDGFMIDADEARTLLSANASNAAVVKPYLTAKDFNTSPTFAAEKWVIDFAQMSFDDACRFIGPMKIVLERVKPYRDTVNRKALKDRWWQFGDSRPGLRKELAKLKKTLVVPLVTKYISFAFIDPAICISNRFCVVPTESTAAFAILQSSVHLLWTLLHSTTLGETLVYTPKYCLETFPFPAVNVWNNLAEPFLAKCGNEYDTHRSQALLDNNEGLTQSYNRFHKPDESSADIQKLRELHIEMDETVAAAYGWTDLDLGHGFHETKQGVRFTINEPSRREVLQRLLKLNHERYAEEVKQGLHGNKGATKKAAPKAKAASKPAKEESTLFDMEDDE